MIRRLYQRFKVSSARGWKIAGAFLGVSALPCPECGTPLIFHVWPIAGLGLVARALKKRYKEKDTGASEMALYRQEGLKASACHPEGHRLDGVVQTDSDATIVDRV